MLSCYGKQRVLETVPPHWDLCHSDELRKKINNKLKKKKKNIRETEGNEEHGEYLIE